MLAGSELPAGWHEESGRQEPLQANGFMIRDG
jgi:hypothetical protein